jgi:hypothetical protein
MVAVCGKIRKPAPGDEAPLHIVDPDLTAVRVGGWREKETRIVLNGRKERSPGRTNRDDSLVNAVGWRLFKSEDIPSRLRRLQTMENTSERSQVTDADGPRSKTLSPASR